LNKIYEEWKTAKAILSSDDKEKFKLPTGIEKTKLT
jgi:hypothetical protein